MVLRLARVEECVAGTLCFRLLSAPSHNNGRVDHLFRELSLQSTSLDCRCPRTMNCPRPSRKNDARCSLGSQTASAQQTCVHESSALRNRPWPESSSTLSCLLRDVISATCDLSAGHREHSIRNSPLWKTDILDTAMREMESTSLDTQARAQRTTGAAK